jgi:hypothetical protein
MREVLGSTDPTSDLVLVSELGSLRLQAELRAAIERARKAFPQDKTFLTIEVWLKAEMNETPADSEPVDEGRFQGSKVSPAEGD